ncbi:MAG: hypothetical protein IJ186_05890 [Bacilli bacterium]|nr:hypothetical protein [Bacilli bacterium]
MKNEKKTPFDNEGAAYDIFKKKVFDLVTSNKITFATGAKLIENFQRHFHIPSTGIISVENN